jgi:DNA-binding GntR family transcriptional regulator
MVTHSDNQQLPAATLSKQIRDALVRQIVSGELVPGERLVETKIAEMFGTSQAPVREALRELEMICLVDIRPRRGTFVRAFVQETLRESFVVRAALEEAATRLVLTAGSLPTAALRVDVERMRAGARADDAQAVSTASVSFHRHVIVAAANELLLRAWEGLQIEARTAATILAIEPNLNHMVSDHEALLESLLSADITTACQHAYEHQWRLKDMSDRISPSAPGHPATT